MESNFTARTEVPNQAAQGPSTSTACDDNSTPENTTSEAKTIKLVTPGKSRKRKLTVSDLDDFDLCVIRRKIQSYYLNNSVPTLRKLHCDLKADINFKGSIESLRKILHKLGFSYKKNKSKRMVLMERYDVVAWRSRFLREIDNNRRSDNPRPIVYLDETYLHPGYKVKKCWQSEETEGVLTEVSEGQRWIIVNAGSEKGFIPNSLLCFKSKTKSGDYHDEMNGDNFSKWLQEKLIPNLEPNSLIVMDNASYHCIKINKRVTMNSKKQEMQDFIKKNNLSYLETMKKAELYEIIKTINQENVYLIDEILKKHGHKAVRLPPYHCDFNAIEFIWSSFKRIFADTNVTGLSENMEQRIHSAFSKITAEEWQKHCNHVINAQRARRIRPINVELGLGAGAVLDGIGACGAGSTLKA
ncbi:uncharacterized protein LOC123690059 [Pieris rapae]|uniref:uncharacterized protein LOC123690059 n=2 Tax=Pieris rapae TaxID=64459 RepID=UPI001E27FA4F|nr:uncharacterized protein LOC123690059 [Pieris rapae]